MRVRWMWILVLACVRPSSGEPLNRDVEGLMAQAGCKEVPLSMNMPNARLDKIFDTLESLSGGCVRFEVDAGAAARRTTVKLRDAALATVLDVLATTNGLTYTVEGGDVRVSAAPAGSPEASAVRDAVRLDLKIGRPADPAHPRLKIKLGECGNVTTSRDEATRIFRLYSDGGRVRESELPGTIVRLRVCPHLSSAGDLELAGEVAVQEVVDEGHGTREERRVWTRTVRAGERDVTLFRTADGGLEVRLAEYEVLRPAVR